MDDHLPELQANLGTYIDLLLNRHVPPDHSAPTSAHLPSFSSSSRYRKKKRVPKRPPRKDRVPSPDYVPPVKPKRKKPHISDPPEHTVPPPPEPPPHQPPPRRKKYDHRQQPPPPPDYPHNSATCSPGLNDHAIAIAEGVLTISPGYSVRIMGSSPDVIQIYHRDFPQWNSKHISSIHGDDDFLFRKRDLLHSNDSQETYLTSGQYDMKGPSNFWYSFRDLSAYPPFSS